MASKRLIGVVAVKGGQVVKSYGYKFWRPAGRLSTALKNLDRWLVDEILVLDISRRASPDPAVVAEIRASRISTPLAYGGGIQTVDDVDSLLAAGCERFVLESMVFKFPERVQSLADKVGAQALIASLPLASKNTECLKGPRDYGVFLGGDLLEFDVDGLCELCNQLSVSEVLAIDAIKEGHAGGFSLLTSDGTHPLTALRKGVIWFGGLDASLAAELLEMHSTVAVGFGNINFEKEVAMRTLRRHVLRNCSNGIVRRAT